MKTSHWITIVIVLVAALGFCVYKHLGHEHAGQAMSEHPGQEHAGKEAQPKSENTLTHEITAVDIKSAMQAHINSEVQKNGGVFKIYDEKTKQILSLKFVKIHDPVRKIEGKGYFACTDFEVVGTPGKLYDLDFWLNPEGDSLTVTDTKIHKEPQRVGNQWEKKERYTFINDNPVEVN